jgi:hypothetical protein
MNKLRRIFLEPFQKKKLRTLAVPIVPVVPRGVKPFEALSDE